MGGLVPLTLLPGCKVRRSSVRHFTTRSHRQNTKGRISFKGLMFCRQMKAGHKQNQIACKPCCHLSGIVLPCRHRSPGQQPCSARCRAGQEGPTKRPCPTSIQHQGGGGDTVVRCHLIRTSFLCLTWIRGLGRRVSVSSLYRTKGPEV